MRFETGLETVLREEEPREDEAATITVPLLWRGGGGGGSTSSVAASLTSSAYCGLTLKFPQRATPSQKERGLAGVELDFVLVK